ncbi:MAG TPA: DinB family protein [Thermoanaerobaculia bacterium]|nr:DinB family protein [Thermoanaerobaculia bacterium]
MTTNTDTPRLERPAADEHAPYHIRYIRLVPDGDIVETLASQIEETQALLRSLSGRADYRYAEGKWTVSQVVRHVADGERAFGYRALSIARGEKRSLLSFDENSWAKHSERDHDEYPALIEELGLLRRANVLMLRALSDLAWLRRGTVNDVPATPRGMAWILAGHERHHAQVLRERYQS